MHELLGQLNAIDHLHGCCSHTQLISAAAAAAYTQVGGRTFKSFKLMARAVRFDAVSGTEVTLAQVESESFKVRRACGCDTFVCCCDYMCCSVFTR
jgi:hypothetical protein